LVDFFFFLGALVVAGNFSDFFFELCFRETEKENQDRDQDREYLRLSLFGTGALVFLMKGLSLVEVGVVFLV
jgi:hypothetical protein